MANTRMEIARTYVLENLSTDDYVLGLNATLQKVCGCDSSASSRILSRLEKEGLLVSRGMTKMRQHRLATPEDRKLPRRRAQALGRGRFKR